MPALSVSATRNCVILEHVRDMFDILLKMCLLNLKSSIFCRATGGVEAERIERDLWIAKERQKITDSVNGKNQTGSQ